MSRPLILTLQIDERAQSHYEELRRCYFPIELNLIPAHLTLFHQLPDEGWIHQTVRAMAESTAEFVLNGPIVRSLGRGVAVYFPSERLESIHASLSLAFQAYLTPQDRQRFKAHIVVQNKVDGAVARRTLIELGDKIFFEPQAVGLTLWRYLGGPWQHICDHRFSAL